MKVKNLFLCFSLLVFSCGLVAQSEAQKPNILFIAIDDLKPTIGSFGDAFALTPAMDALSKEATIFLNNHTQQAVCGPSRASLMTGKRPDYTKVRDLKTKMRDINPDILTIPEHFKNNGYQTLGVGKIYDPRCVDKKRDEPSWSVPFVKENQLEFSSEYGPPAMGYYQNKDIKNKVRQLRAEASSKGIKNTHKYVRDKYKPPFGSANVPDEAYTDGAIASRANLMLQDLSQNQSAPFFLAVGFKRPHLPFTAPQKYWDLYDKKDIKLATFQKKSVNGPNLAYHNSGEMRSYKAPGIDYVITNENLLDLEDAHQKDLIHGYYACTSFIDAQIGKILQTLKATGLDKNTIVVIWGDHGWHLGDHSLWNKHSNFEQATRSPLIIYNPKVKKGVKVTSPTEFVDIFPTLCEAANLNTPSNLDGTSLNSLVEGASVSPKSYAVSQWQSGNKTGYSFRTEQYRYTVWVSNKKSTDPIFQKDIYAEELYDYKLDPNETYNRIDDENYFVFKKRFQKLAARYFKSQRIETIKTEKVPLNTSKLIIGATLNHHEMDSKKGALFLKDFNYLTPANAAKQSRIHPEPNVWDWKKIDDFIAYSKANNLIVRMHGPSSPQASKWAKDDFRTAGELQSVLVDFMTATTKRYNTIPNIKWMDVVNETVLPNGKWFGPKKGNTLWENPWLKMGLDSNGFPNYILKSFEIATKHATNIKLVYNHHAGMQPKMWDKVKETILYIRSQGHRVDAIGWQGHINLSSSTRGFIKDTENTLQQLSELIDWAHSNNLEFHLTELDYKITDKSNIKQEHLIQAELYSKLVSLLESKTSTGVVALNLWDMGERFKRNTGYFQSIYDADLKPTPAYQIIKNALKN